MCSSSALLSCSFSSSPGAHVALTTYNSHGNKVMMMMMMMMMMYHDDDQVSNRTNSGCHVTVYGTPMIQAKKFSDTGESREINMAVLELRLMFDRKPRRNDRRPAPPYGHPPLTKDFIYLLLAIRSVASGAALQLMP